MRVRWQVTLFKNFSIGLGLDSFSMSAFYSQIRALIPRIDYDGQKYCRKKLHIRSKRVTQYVKTKRFVQIQKIVSTVIYFPICNEFHLQKKIIF
jgi:hypothetical protein